MKYLKTIIIGLLLTFVFSVQSFAYDSNISVHETTLTVIASGTKNTVPIVLDSVEGFFSVQVVITGSGTMTLSYQLSNSKVAPQIWSTPVGATAIATGLTAGTYLYKFEPHTIGKWLRLTFTETGTSDPFTVSCNLVYQ
jgi:hypothetical protein